MEIKIDGSEFLKHLSFWHNKSDEECIELAKNEEGSLNAESALMNMLERDFCTSLNNIIKGLMDISKNDKNI